MQKHISPKTFDSLVMDRLACDVTSPLNTLNKIHEERNMRILSSIVRSNSGRKAIQAGCFHKFCEHSGGTIICVAIQVGNQTRVPINGSVDYETPP